MKFRSSMTLFARGAVDKDKIRIRKYSSDAWKNISGGEPDRLTLAALPNF